MRTWSAVLIAAGLIGCQIPDSRVSQPISAVVLEGRWTPLPSAWTRTWASLTGHRPLLPTIEFHYDQRCTANDVFVAFLAACNDAPTRHRKDVICSWGLQTEEGTTFQEVWLLASPLRTKEFLAARMSLFSDDDGNLALYGYCMDGDQFSLFHAVEG